MLESIVFYMPQIEHQVGGLCFKKKMKIRESTRSLYTSFKGIIHLSQWRKLVSDGSG